MDIDIGDLFLIALVIVFVGGPVVGFVLIVRDVVESRRRGAEIREKDDPQ